MKYLVLLFLTVSANAMDYDIDPEPTSDPKIWVVNVTVNGCITKFKIPVEDIKKLSTDDKSIKDMVDLSVDRANNNCF